MPQWNNVFENIKIEGYKTGYAERYRMSANYNIYNNIDTSGCQYVKSAEGNGTGTAEDIGFNFLLLMDKKEKDMMKLLEIKLFLGIILML